MRSEEYLREIRKSEGLQRAILSKIEVEGDKVTFRLLTDTTYSDEDIAFARRVSARFTPVGYQADVRVIKSVPSADAVKIFLCDYLKRAFPAVAAFVSPDDITAEAGKGGGHFAIGTASDEKIADETLDEICRETERNFCGVWSGEFRVIKKNLGGFEYADVPEEYVAAPRYFPVVQSSPIDGAKPKIALYLADLTKEIKDVTVCGNVVAIEERQTKSGKPFFSLTVSDGTGQLRCSYFSRKATLEKVRAVKAGDYICLTGDNEVYNGSLSFRAKQMDYGKPPQDFVPEERPSRAVPTRYKTVFPTPESDFMQAGLFGERPLPDVFKQTDFVVFDLETTGLHNSSADNMDRIIEVGAVKIHGGEICEKFSSFVACPVKLSEEIIDLTGITDDMLKGAPQVSDVIADFFKFCAGAVLVGHNVQFDYKFIRFYGEREGFIFDQRQYDTCSFAQELLHLKNYKLNTVADHFSFTFNHHRAYDDAFVTAKIFTELVRIKGDLPK